MRFIIKTLIVALSCAFLTIGSALAAGQVALYNWFEYIPPELLEKFTKETGIKVVEYNYDSNEEMLEKLEKDGIGKYDLAVPAEYAVKEMIETGMLGTIKIGELDNRNNIEPQWLDIWFDNGRNHSIPYQWGSTSFAVNRDIYRGQADSTDILFNPPAALSGKISVLDSQEEVMALAALHLGIPQCTIDRKQIEKLNAALQKANKHWAAFNSETAEYELAEGNVAVAMVYNGDSARVREEGANVEYIYPKQGYIIWADSLVLLKDAPNRANAIKFIDFMLVPANVAALTNYTRYSAGVKNVTPLLDDDLRVLPENNPFSSAGAPIFIKGCDEKAQRLYDRIWNKLKK